MFNIFKNSNKQQIDNLVYPVGTEVWGFFHPSFKSIGGNRNCKKARFEKFLVESNTSNFSDNKLISSSYYPNFQDLSYDLTYIKLDGKYVDKDLNKLKERVLDFAEFSNIDN